MDRRVRELIILCLLSAFLCGLAWSTDYQAEAAIFAALACAIGVLAVALRNKI
jgi:hypothetical protein